MLFRLAVILPFVLFAVIVLAVVSLVLWPYKVLGIGDGTLAYSLEQELGGGKARCKQRERDFACMLRRSGERDEYLVRVRDDCWRARRPGDRPGQSHLRGCIGLDDYLRLPSLGSQ